MIRILVFFSVLFFSISANATTWINVDRHEYKATCTVGCVGEVRFSITVNEGVDIFNSTTADLYVFRMSNIGIGSVAEHSFGNEWSRTALSWSGTASGITLTSSHDYPIHGVYNYSFFANILSGAWFLDWANTPQFVFDATGPISGTDFEFVGMTKQLSNVPLPSGLPLFGAGIGLIVWLRSRKNNRSKDTTTIA